jgi:hypothetical protein
MRIRLNTAALHILVKVEIISRNLRRGEEEEAEESVREFRAGTRPRRARSSRGPE